MGCVESMNYEILMRDASFRECRDYIKQHFKEFIDVQPGFKIFDVHLIGVPPIAIGLDADFIVFPVYKTLPWHVSLRVEDTAEAARLRTLKK